MKLAIVGDPQESADRAGRRYDIGSLADALARRGNDVQLLTASASAGRGKSGAHTVVQIPVEAPESGGAEALMPMIGEIGRFLVDHWDGEPPDVVHCHGWVYGMAAQLAANRRPVPTVQAFDHLATHGTAAKLEALLVRDATMVTAACSDEMLKAVRMGCPRAHASVLPSGIDVDAFSVEGTTAPRGNARHRIVAVARDFSVRHGLGDAVRILPSLPAAELVMTGAGAADDHDAHHLLSLASDIGVGERTHLLSLDDGHDVAALLRSADVAVCPSPHDADTTTVLRAMACGAAVVAPEIGGPRDAVIADVTGLLVPPGNTAALSNALRSILRQNVLRQGMGLAGRARARSRYSWDRIATDAEVVYHAAARRAAVIPA